MRRRLILLAAVLATVLLAAVPCAGQQEDELQKLREQMKLMQQMMRDMQAKIDELEAARALVPGEGKQPALAQEISGEPALSPALTERQTVSDNPYGVARVDNAPLDPKMRGFFSLPGTRTIMRIGGYSKLDAIHDFRPAGNPDWFVTSSIPIEPVADAHNTEIHVRQTRLNLELRRPASGGGDLRFFYENDFTGSGGQRAYNLRHAYGQWKNLLAGFTFSTFNDLDSLPDTLDYEGPGSAIFCYNPQIRYTWPITPRHSLAFAVEQPKSDIPTAVPGYGPAEITPTSPWPDFVVRYRYEADRGHLQLGSVLRSVGAFYRSEKDVKFCYGLSLGGAVRLGHLDNFLFQANYGEGVSRYINDLGGLGYDIGVAPDGHVHPLPVYGGFLAYEHYWTESLRSTLTCGHLRADTYYLPRDSAFKSSTYAAANLIYVVKGALTVGLEVLYGNHFVKDGRQGDATRVQFSFQYDLVK